MLSEVCKELRNWFDRNQPKLYGEFEISDGKIVTGNFITLIKLNQYFRIVGSTFNDGVYKYTDNLVLTDETFSGSIWLMAIPAEVISLSSDIEEWEKQYGDSVNSPYTSESFGGYSYSKAVNSAGKAESSWKDAFASKLNRWRKL